ncbi:hypothetical protein [Gimesia sp.]|uniref:hypothetical protein n=1 Tax=Gimesia sp. TaxID=2024833 RepID=UPI003A91C2FB
MIHSVIVYVQLTRPSINVFFIHPTQKRDLTMTFFQILVLYILCFLIYNVRRNNQRIRKLKQDVAQLEEKLKTEDG